MAKPHPALGGVVTEARGKGEGCPGDLGVLIRQFAQASPSIHLAVGDGRSGVWNLTAKGEGMAGASGIATEGQGAEQGKHGEP